MVWSAFGWTGKCPIVFIDHQMNPAGYCNKLQQLLLPHLHSLAVNPVTFQLDGAPIHRSHTILDRAHRSHELPSWLTGLLFRPELHGKHVGHPCLSRVRRLQAVHQHAGAARRWHHAQLHWQHEEKTGEGSNRCVGVTFMWILCGFLCVFHRCLQLVPKWHF